MWIVLCLLCVAGAWLFWRLENRPAGTSAAPDHFSYTAPRPVLPGQLPAGNAPVPARVKEALATNAFALRLSNTPKSIGELVNDPHAILLENALIDTRSPLNFSIPAHLRATGDAGAYIVQARGPVTAAFRAALAQAGAEIVSYIPNDAYLVRVGAGGAGGLAANPLTQSVIPYEPYYKIQSSLLNAAVDQELLPDGAVLNLGLFADGAAQTISQIEKLGGKVLARDRSPFGPLLRVQPPANWTALAALPGVQIVEAFHPRVHANDLSRVSTGVSTDTITNTSYLGLSGLNVIVQVNDSGIDATHPDFTTGGNPTTAGGAPVRVIGLTTNDLADADGHGTFVAGEIAGNGAASINPTPVGTVLASMNFGSVSNADFRGKAPLATLFSMKLSDYSHRELQEAAALTNALISNNSWNDGGDNSYSLDAASFDAATRDALSEVTGSQPVLFVFSAGNAGGGDNSHDPGGGNRNSIESPATAKNVITVGAIQENRSITNSVTNFSGSVSTPWLPETSTSYRLAGFSSRGNVGIGIEGTYGRFKPDVVAPGTFVVSTRSAQWDAYSYFYQNPTNYATQTFTGVTVNPHARRTSGFPIVPTNAVAVSIVTRPNVNSPYLYPSPVSLMPIYFAFVGTPFPGSTFTTSGSVHVPSDGGWSIANILSSERVVGFNYAFSNLTSGTIKFDYTTTIVTTNGQGNQNLVYSNLDNNIGPYYRFESGTSMSAADVSGVLALMADFFTNTLHQTPSPAMLKAMLINGARPTGAYDLQVNNAINYEGWGLVNLPNSLPTNTLTSYDGSGTLPSSIFIQDQSTTNALATGDSQAFTVAVQTNMATLRVTLAWTDPPGNPTAAIKLVNSLELVVTNSDNPTNPVVYYGNDIPAGGVFNTAESASNSVSVDVINNVQSVIIPQPLGTNYTVAVIGREVNVNAVSAQMNNDVQDFALVISSGDGNAPGLFTVTPAGIVSNPTGDQNVTFVTTTNQPLLNQFVGANTPLLGTNTTGLGTNTPWSSSGALTAGMTNQWHFYVATNTGPGSDFTNAGFVTIQPLTLSIPREGVFAGSQANATRPQADIDLYVTTDATLTNLNPIALTNCLLGGQVGVSSGSAPAFVFNGASLTRAGTEFVVDTHSTPGQVYYIGVKSEAQTASEYTFVPIFSNIPFSQTNNNGDETVNGMLVPVNIPDGTPADPGVGFSIGLAIFPITVGDITVTNIITHQNFGDLYGTLTHSDNASGLDTVDVLNNHNAWSSIVNWEFIYNDTNTVVFTGVDPITGNPTVTGPSAGPGSLKLFNGQDGSGVWQMTEVDDSLSQTGSVQNFTMFIKRHRDLLGGSINTIPPHSMFFDFVDVPAGVTNLTMSATNVSGTVDAANPLLMVIKFGSQPTLGNADKGPVALTNGSPPGNSLSVGPTDVPPIQPGRYWVGITNQSNTAQDVFVIATILPANPSGTTTDFASTGSIPLLDDAVSFSDPIDVSSTQPIVSVNVGIRVDHPRISDLVFHLISPNGARILLMENRGGDTTNGAGATYVITNTVSDSAGGSGLANTNPINAGEISGTIPITYNFYTAKDEMTVYYGTNVDPTMLILDTGFTNNPSLGPGAQNTQPETLSVTFGPTNGVVSTYLTVIMNQFGNPNGPNGTAWIYTFGGVLTNYAYLTFTEDTNLTTTPIKYAVPPFVPLVTAPMLLWTDSFEAYTAPATNTQGSTFGKWAVLTNQVVIATNPPAYDGAKFLALTTGAVSNNLPTAAGRKYLLQYAVGRQPLTALFVANINNGVDSPVSEFDLGGNGSIFNNTLVNAWALTFDSSGNLYVADNTDNTIYKFTPGGQKSIFATNSLNSPEGLAFDSSGNLYVANAGDGKIVEFTPGGVGSIFASGLNNPDALAFDGKGNLYVANSGDNTIEIFTNANAGANAIYLTSANGLDGPAGLAFDNSGTNLYVANLGGGAAGPSVEEFTPPSTNVIIIANATIIPALSGPAALAFDSIGNLYMADYSGSVIYKFPTNGTPGLGSPVVFAINVSGDLSSPNGLAFYTTDAEDTNNANWHLTSLVFTASRTNEPLVLDASGGGFAAASGGVITTAFADNTLFDDFSLTALPGDLYYLPEQGLNTLAGQSANGEWQLEIQDDRAGAYDSNSTPALVSWDLQFVFANTTAVPANLNGGIGQSNQFIPANSIAWYQINVPATANYATNLLLFATAPGVNVWFDTNNPPTTNILFLNGTSGTKLMSTTNPPDGNLQLPPNIYDGQTYYLGVQNPNSFTVNYGIEVIFDHGNAPDSGSPASISSVSASGSGTTLKWKASPTAHFEVQWKDDLAQPWNTDTNVITSSTGNFTFTDNGSQTAPLGPMRFYRLVQISP